MNAVAPYDAWSQSDAHFLEVELNDLILSAQEQCLAGAGHQVSLPRMPRVEREEVMGELVDEFPDLEQLESEGFPLVPADGDNGSGRVPDEPDIDPSALANCTEEDPAVTTALEANDLYWELRGAWFGVRSDIDTTDEVQDEMVKFSECLISNGVAREHSTGPGVYIDSLDAAASVEETVEGMETVLEEGGKLYARCVTDLDAKRQELRKGERRDEFLNEHAAEIVKLADILEGTETESARRR